MKKFRKRYEDLRSKAEQFKQVLEAAPAKAAELRQVITRTVDEFQQLKDDFRIGSAAFPEVLQQIAARSDALDGTGYSLNRVEMEMGVNARLIVHLNRDEETSAQTLEALRQQNQDNVVMRSLIAALIKAEEVAARVNLPGMTYRALAVEVGMIPCVRLAWWSDALYAEEEAVQPPPLPAASTAPAPAPQQQPATSFFGEGSFFERRPPPAPAPAAEAKTSAEPAPGVPSSAPAATSGEAAKPAEPAASTGDWRQDALARFKKMPDLSRYSR